MNYSTLKQTLTVVDGGVTVSTGELTPNFDAFLVAYYSGGPFGVDGATVVFDDAAQTVAVSGISAADFLGVSNPAVVATFKADDSGNVQAVVRYNLVGSGANGSGWTFGTSFPNLPTVAGPNGDGSPLSALSLSQASYLVSTSEVGAYSYLPGDGSAATSIALQAGINFAGRFAPSNVLGVLLDAIGDGTLTIFGTVAPGAGDATIPPLATGAFPWNRTDAAGISLQALLLPSLSLSNLGGGGVKADGGGLALESVLYRLYSPPSTAWGANNPTFVPLLGYSGGLSIPSASLSLDVDATTAWDGKSTTFFATPGATTLSALSALADGSGGASLLAALPPEIQSGNLAGLLLAEAAATISASNGSLSVDSTSFTVGMSQLDWSVWSDPACGVDSVVAVFEIDAPFDDAKRKVNVSLTGALTIGGKPLTIVASNADGFTVTATLGATETIVLSDLLSSYVPSFPVDVDLGALDIDSLVVTLDPATSYSMQASLAQEPNPWVIRVGALTIDTSDVTMSLVYPKGGPVGGKFGGTLAIPDLATVDLDYEIPGNVKILADFPTVTLQTLVQKVVGALSTGSSLAWPSGFNPEFEDSFLLLQRQAGVWSFEFATTVTDNGSDVGTFVFVAQDNAGKAGFAVGFNVDVASIGALIGESFVQDMVNLIAPSDLQIIVSDNMDAGGFQFPTFADFNQVPPKTGDVGAPTSGLMDGLNVYAKWALDPTSQKQGLLKGLLKECPQIDGSLLVVMELQSLTNAQLYVQLDATIENVPIDVQIGVKYFVVDDAPNIDFFLSGTFTINLSDDPKNPNDQTFNVTLAFLEDGALVTGSMSGTKGVTFYGVTLSDLAVLIGVSWEGVPSFGVTATIDVSLADEPFDSSVAFFFDSATEPPQLLVAGSVSDVTLAEIVKTIAGAEMPNDPALVSALGKISIAGTNAFTFADATAAATALGSLDLAGVSGAFAGATPSVAVPSAAGHLLINGPIVMDQTTSWFVTDIDGMNHYELTRVGDGPMSGKLEAQFLVAPTAPISIGLFTVSEVTFRVSGKITFFFVSVTCDIDVSKDEGVSIEVDVDPIQIYSAHVFSLTSASGSGGPHLSVSTLSASTSNPKGPHFDLNGKVTLLGVTESLLVEASESGLNFQLKDVFGAGLSMTLDVTIDGSQGLLASGGLNLMLGDLDLSDVGMGKVSVDTGLTGTATLSASINPLSASGGFSATFAFLGDTVSVDYSFNVDVDSLGNLAEKAADEAAAALKQYFYDDCSRWADAFVQGIVAGIGGIDDAVQVLIKVFDQTESAALALLNVAVKAGGSCPMTKAVASM